MSRRRSSRLWVALLALIAVSWGAVWLLGVRPDRDGRPDESGFLPRPHDAPSVSQFGSDVDARLAIDSIHAEVGAAAPADTPAGSSVLRVRVCDARQQPVTRGEIVCNWAPTTPIEVSPQSGLVRAKINSVETLITLPRDANAAAVVVVTDGLSPSREFVDGLRYRANRTRFQADEIAERIVLVTLSPEGSGHFLRGSVFVDDVPSLPAELKVLGVHVDGSSQASGLLPDSNEYVVCSLTPALSGLWATSATTAPQWIPLRDLPAEGRVDLRLVRSPELTVRVVDDGDRAPVQDVRVRVAVDVPVGEVAVKRGRKANQFRHVVSERISDESGEARFGDLTREGRATITVDSEHSTRHVQRREIVVDLAKVRSSGDSVEIPVSFEAPRVQVEIIVGRDVWGEPGSVQHSDLAVRYKQSKPGAIVYNVANRDGGWFFSALPEIEYTVWAELEQSIASDPVSFTARPGENGRTLTLTRSTPSNCRVEWTGLTADANLTFRVTRKGLAVGNAIDELPSTPSGSVVLSAQRGDEIHCLVRQSDGNVHSRQFAVSDTSERFQLTFESITARVRVGVETPRGPGTLLLQSMDSCKESMVATIPCQNGSSTSAAALSSGRYFFRYVARDYPGLLVGTLNIDKDQRQVLAFSDAAPTPIAQICPQWSADSELELEGGGEFGAQLLVHESLRRFSARSIDPSSAAGVPNTYWLPTARVDYSCH